MCSVPELPPMRTTAAAASTLLVTASLSEVRKVRRPGSVAPGSISPTKW
jgi:hypothetical protein